MDANSYPAPTLIKIEHHSRDGRDVVKRSSSREHRRVRIIRLTGQSEQGRSHEEALEIETEPDPVGHPCLEAETVIERERSRFAEAREVSPQGIACDGFCLVGRYSVPPMPKLKNGRTVRPSSASK